MQLRTLNCFKSCQSNSIRFKLNHKKVNRYFFLSAFLLLIVPDCYAEAKVQNEAPKPTLGVAGSRIDINSPPGNTSAVTWDKKIHLKGITLTPGGFFAGEGLYRTRNEQSDILSSFGNIPLGNNPLYYMKELRFTARQSRLALLVEGPVNSSTLVSGYFESDFLGNGTANSNESNSFDLRIRAFYAALDWMDRGWHILAGQNWSLISTNMQGITPRNELMPPTIDAQYVVGFLWKRQAQFRLTKNFGSKLWAAVSAENPQTTFGGTACGTNFGNGVITQTCTAPGNQSLPSVTSFSINHIPDVIAKLAYENTFINHKVHLEVFGLHRNFYNRVQYIANINQNRNTEGYGIGAGGFLEIIPKLLDLQGNFLAGRGIGSYASGLLPDVTLSSNGSLRAIPEVEFMAGFTVHVNPKWDVYFFGGGERENARYFNIGNNYFGYGVPNANNTGCRIDFGVCAGNTKALWQLTTGLWNKFYQGAFGEVRAGVQYSYTNRELFAGTGGEKVKPFIPIGYHANEQMVLFSLRYYPYLVFK